MPSLSTPLRNAASATTHSSASPCRDAAIVADTMSPAPMPAAATSRPGPISLMTLAQAGVWTIAVNRHAGCGAACACRHTMTRGRSAHDSRHGRRTDRHDDDGGRGGPTVADAGIERVFGLPGGEVLVLIDELRKAGVDFVLMRHEANAGIAAAVYGKLRGQPGVVLATLGPGAANLMLPIAQRVSRSGTAARDLGADPRRVSREPHASAAAAARRLPADRAVRGTRSPRENVGDVVPRALAACMERPFGAAYLTLSAREALKPAARRAARVAVGSRFVRRTLPAERNAARSARRAVGLAGSAKRPLVVDRARHRPGQRARASAGGSTRGTSRSPSRRRSKASSTKPARTSSAWSAGWRPTA